MAARKKVAGRPAEDGPITIHAGGATKLQVRKFVDIDPVIAARLVEIGELFNDSHDYESLDELLTFVGWGKDDWLNYMLELIEANYFGARERIILQSRLNRYMLPSQEMVDVLIEDGSVDPEFAPTVDKRKTAPVRKTTPAKSAGRPAKKTTTTAPVKKTETTTKSPVRKTVVKKTGVRLNAPKKESK